MRQRVAKEASLAVDPLPDPSAIGGPELVYGLIGAMGTPLSGIWEALETQLRSVGYSSERIKLTSLIAALPGSEWQRPPAAPVKERY